MNTRVSRRFRPVNMNGCVLYLPFYAYGANAQVAWDISGQGNHGVPTNVAPGSQPTLPFLNKITNPTFDSDTGWTKGTGWTIASNKATHAAGTASDLEQDVSVVAGKQYYIFAYYNRSAGTVTPQLGGTNGTAYSATAITGEVIRATNTGNLKYQASADYAGYVRYLACYEVVANETLGWNFNTSGNRIVIPDFTETGNSATELTALCWAYPQLDATVYLAHADTTAQVAWYFQKNSSTPSFGDLNAGATFIISTNGTLTAGTTKYYQTSLLHRSFTWVLFGFSFNSGVLNLYVQGVLDTSPTKVWDPSITTIHDSTADLSVGNYAISGVYGAGFRGLVGESLIFNRALSTQEHRDFFERTRHRYGV